MNFSERVLLYELSLNDTDDQVIQYIETHKALIVKQSIQTTAKALYTVPNTIVRLSKKLGYSSFSEMKFELKQELNQSLDDSKKVITNLPKSVEKTLQLIDQNQIRKVSQLILHARDVLFVGVGDTQIFCEMFSKNLTCVNIAHRYYSHRHETLYHLNQLKSKDVCIIISVRGENPEVLEAVEIAKKRFATVITLTHFHKNPLAEKADINLYFYGKYELLNNYNVTDLSGLMLLIRVMCESIWKTYELNK